MGIFRNADVVPGWIQGRWPAGAKMGERRPRHGRLALSVVPSGACVEEAAEAYGEDQATIEAMFQNAPRRQTRLTNFGGCTVFI